MRQADCNLSILIYVSWLFPESGLVYPVAAPYEHDPTGDSSDDSYPEAVAYVHDTTGDA